MKDFDINKTKSAINVPFGSVSREFIESIHADAFPFTYEEWLYWSSYHDKMANYYNIAMFNEEGEMIAFEYGTWGPCGEGMYLIRAIIHAEYKEHHKEIIKKGFDNIRKLARVLGMKRVYSITSIGKFFLERYPEDFRQVKAMVLEVTDV